MQKLLAVKNPPIRNAKLFLAFILCCSSPSSAIADGWRAGAARISITPQQLMWLSGYGDRDKPAQGKLTELEAKALVLEDADGKRVALVTMDLVGIDRPIALQVRRQIERQYGIPQAAIALATSHTHSGPVVGSNLGPTFELDEKQRRLVDEYAVVLADKLVSVVGAAIDDLTPAQLSFGDGKATFAVNRRNNPEEIGQLRATGKLNGPVDHDVPVLAVRDMAGSVRAIVCGYACHATVLQSLLWCGDWPGYAQMELEKEYPGAIALYWAGCGADQNPLPRRTVELAQQHGREAANAVGLVLQGPMESISPCLEFNYQEIDLAFDELPSRSELENSALSSEPYTARYAKQLLKQWDQNGGLSRTYPFPIQVWRLGAELRWILLGGEVVVDYALRLKSDFEPKTTWITAYANDVMGYIPSRRVLSEGGYEGGDSRLYYGLPANWSPQVERQIINKVHELAEYNFESLFNGRDLTGWQGEKDGYVARDGVLACSKEVEAHNLYTDKTYDDFVLRFDFRLTPGANSGIGLRAPIGSEAVSRAGIELQILDDSAAEHQSLEPYQYHGSVYGVVPARRGALRPVGEWNFQEVKLDGDHIEVRLNGQTIVDAHLNDFSADAAADDAPHPGIHRSNGHIALLGHGTAVEFRDLRVHSLTPAAQ